MSRPTAGFLILFLIVLVKTETLRAVGGFDAGADHFDDRSAWLPVADR